MNSTIQAASRVIIDTDVGGDDMTAMLLAMAALPTVMEVVLFTAVFGNVNMERSLTNILTMFNILSLEMDWREKQGMPLGFEAFRAFKPLVSAGSNHALGKPFINQTDGYHGPDGLQNFSTLYPELNPDESWRSLFNTSIPAPKEEPAFFKHFKASKLPAHREIIRVLKENPPNTISVVALGPMTNVAMAAAEDPEAMLRMKELLVMGGTIDSPGNASPVAEFNTFYDPMACARSFALSSPDPNSTMPPSNNSGRYFDAYPENLPEALKVRLFPLDITLTNCVDYKNFTEKIQGQLESKGPLATMVNTYFDGLHKKDPSNSCVVQHDPLPLWYALTSENAPWDMSSPKDIRVETSGQWTTGMDVVDRRATPRANGINETEVSEDPLGWLSSVRGNRIVQALKSPGADEFNERFLMLFGL